MAGEKPPTSEGLGAHEILRGRLLGQLPASGDRRLSLTVDEIIGLLSEYHYLKGQVEGLREGGELLKDIVEGRNN